MDTLVWAPQKSAFRFCIMINEKPQDLIAQAVIDNN